MAPVAEVAEDIAADAALSIASCAKNGSDAKAAAAAAADVLDGAVVEVLDPRLATVHVEPNTGEEDDHDMPKNLHNAAELFVKTGKVDAAQRLQRCALVFFALTEGRCSSDGAVVGRACVCWRCGHCGLEQRPESSRVCAHCGDGSQTNYVQVVLADGISIPWKEVCREPVVVELKDADDKEKKRAAVAAAVEAARQAQNKAAAEVEGSQLESFNPRLTAIQVCPNAGEGEHPNFPKNLHSALELLARVKHLDAARKLQRCTNEYLQILDEGPQAAGAMGPGFVCFECGFCGLAPEGQEDGAGPKEESEAKACACTSCGSDGHTNFVQLALPNGQQLPWMERAARATSAATPAGRGDPGATRSSRVKPNEPCPCGSGKKAKKCCNAGGA